MISSSVRSMIDRALTNRLMLAFFLAPFISIVLEGCIRQNKDVMIQGAEKPNKYSFINEEKVRYFFDCFVNDTSSIPNVEKQKITILIDNTKRNNEISIYRMPSFAYTIERSVFLGAPVSGEDRILVFCKDSVPSFIDTLYLDYKKGLEYLGEDALYYMWDSIRPQGDCMVLRQDANGGWALFDRGSIGEQKNVPISKPRDAE